MVLKANPVIFIQFIDSIFNWVMPINYTQTYEHEFWRIYNTRNKVNINFYVRLSGQLWSILALHWWGSSSNAVSDKLLPEHFCDSSRYKVSCLMFMFKIGYNRWSIGLFMGSNLVCWKFSLQNVWEIYCGIVLQWIFHGNFEYFKIEMIAFDTKSSNVAVESKKTQI